MRSVKRRRSAQRRRVAHGQAQTAVGQDALRRVGKVADAPAGAVDLQDTAAVVHGGGGGEDAGLEDGAVGAAAADVDVGDGGEVRLRIMGGPRPTPGDQALDMRPGHADHKLAGQPGQPGQHRIGVFLLGCFAGDDDRACLHLARVDAGRGILAPDDGRELRGVHRVAIQQRREDDRALVDHLAIR